MNFLSLVSYVILTYGSYNILNNKKNLNSYEVYIDKYTKVISFLHFLMLTLLVIYLIFNKQKVVEGLRSICKLLSPP